MTRKVSDFPRIILKKGREKPLLNGHPWVYSGAVEKVDGEVIPGEIGDVYSKEGNFLGRGYINPNSQIIFRLLSKKKEPIEKDFFKEMIIRAKNFKERLLKNKTDAYRMVNGEGDSLPGLIIDRYGKVIVLQFLTAGMERSKDIIYELIIELFNPDTIYERSDVPVRDDEGLKEVKGLIYGKEIDNFVEIKEYDCHFKVDIKNGQKTGFYLDQRENRFSLREFSLGKRVLDCFCYTGAFSIHSGLGGAKEITLIDSSETALEMAKENLMLNDLRNISFQLIKGDAFEILRGLKPNYDIIILDPPPFAKRKVHLASASRGYKDINLLAFRLLKKEGLLFTFSCSHHLSWDLFQKIVFSSAIDGEREAQFLGRKGHPVDHPFQLSHPEGEYLRGFVLRIL